MNPNKDRFAWGVIVAEWKPGNPTPSQANMIGQWCLGTGTLPSKNDRVIYLLKEEAETFAKTWSKYDWLYAAKKYPLHRKS